MIRVVGERLKKIVNLMRWNKISKVVGPINIKCTKINVVEESGEYS